MTQNTNHIGEGEATAGPLERPKGGIITAESLPNSSVNLLQREGEATAEPLERPKGGINSAESLPNSSVNLLQREGEATAEPLAPTTIQIQIAFLDGATRQSG